MKKLAVLNCFGALFTLSVALMVFPDPARAYVYDDFGNPGINASLWVDGGPNEGLFSVPGDGYLYFNDSNFKDSSGVEDDRLISHGPLSGAFFVSIRYFDFQSNNMQPAGKGLSSAVQLGLGDGNNSVRMIEGKNHDGLFFQPLSLIGGIRTSLKFVPTDIKSGWLGIGYNGVLGSGGEVTFWYDSGAGWMKLDSCAPNFSQAPFFSIRGIDFDPVPSLSFRVDQVQIVPSPPIQVKIDLKPGSNPNCVNPKSKGKTTVAIYGSNTFNVADIDQASLRFGGAPPLWCIVADAIMEGPTLVFTQDEIPDLVCHFDTSQIAWPPAGSDCGIVKLTGTLNNGVSIQGSDAACLAGEPTCSSGTPIPVP